MTLRRAGEHYIQAAFFDLVRLRRQTDDRWRLIFAIPNGGHRNIVTARRLKLEGVEAGIPDVFCAVPAGDYAGLWLEFKTQRGSLSREQRAVIARLREAGYRVEVVRDPEAAMQIVETYLDGTQCDSGTGRRL